MLKKIRNLFLLKNNFLGEPKVLDRKTYMALSDEEKALADVRVEDDNYIVQTPLDVTDEEINELIGITISNELTKIREFLEEIKFILQFSLISAIVVGLITFIISLIS